jgi:hypothetical protein
MFYSDVIFTIRLSEKCCLNEFSCYFGMLRIDDI